MSPLDFALTYINRSWATVPVPFKGKKPDPLLGDDWHHLVITAETAPKYFNGQKQNIGVILGQQSGDLTDADLDCPEAIALAPAFLPNTSAIFGRASKPQSHRLYLSDLCNTEDKAALQFREPKADGKGAGAMLIELRFGGGGKGAQTVFPGSVHESGEPVLWVSDGDPARVDGADLKRVVARLAAAALLVRHYPADGSRHDVALTLGGALARANWPANQIQKFIGLVARTAGDNEWQERGRSAAGAVDQLKNGGKVRGLPSLVDAFDKAVTNKLVQWLALKSGAGPLPSDDLPPPDQPPSPDHSTGPKKGKEGGFDIIALAGDAASADDATGWSTVIRFQNPDGALCEAHVSKAALIKEPNAALADLVDRGLKIETRRQAKNRIVALLVAAEPKERRIIARRVGWSGGAKRVFILPDEIIGMHINERVFWALGAHRYEKRGTLDAWREQIAKPAGDQRMLRFSISLSFAGTLLKLGHFESAMFHLFGFSSVGKTTCERVAAASWGSGADGDYIRPWRTTAGAMEAALSSTCDTVGLFDETGQADIRDLRPAAYMITGSSGKSRLNRDSTEKPSYKWRTLALSTGEKPFAQLLRDGQNGAQAGQLVRVIDLSVGDSVFDHYPDFDPKAFADKMKLASSTSCGWAGPEFVRQLIARNVTGEAVREKVRAFVASALKDHSGERAQAERVAERFGLVAAAGELAIEFALLPWIKNKPTEDAKTLFDQWIERRGGTGAAEPDIIIAHVRRLIEVHGEARFEEVLDTPKKNNYGQPIEPRPVINRMGYRVERRWMVFPEVWRTEFCAGFDPAKVADVLIHEGMLEPGEGRNHAKKVSIRGDKVRLYVLTPAVFERD
jgi:uncharacterized protein (DUF927 family)